MLSSLHIRNYVLIDSLDIDFPEGLVIITGQTGAGKSILLGALSLVAGAKADASMISPGASSCVVEAEFDVPDGTQALRELLEENDVEWDGGHIIARRVVNPTGRSRCFVNDSPVNVQTLSELSTYLVDIHSQHQSLLLTDHGFQLSLLDAYAGNEELLAGCRGAWNRSQELRRELESVRSRLASLSTARDYNDSQFRELDSANLRDGELEELEEEQKTLANAEQILSDLFAAGEMFSPDESSGMRTMGSCLKEAGKLIARVSRYMPSLVTLVYRIDSARIEVEDISAEIEDAASRINVSGERLHQVEERMSALYSLMTKHGCRSVAELIGIREKYSSELFDSTALAEQEASLAVELESAGKELNEWCRRLHDARSSASEPFAASVLESLRFLELDRSVFSVSLSDAQCGPSGSDSVAFLFSASGLNPQDVSRCASGGELSRIMLSLKAIMARTRARTTSVEVMPTMIFDEIDTGVSGSVADRMGSMICSMGVDMQIFSITHLPQVAAKGKAHYVVSKSFDETDGRAVSTIRKVAGDERVREIARLLSGSSITPEAIANARALLDS